MFENYLPQIQRFLGTEDLDIQDTDFGKVAIKGNWTPPQALTNFEIRGTPLRLQGCVLHERVLYFEKDIPIRSHEEELGEIIFDLKGHLTLQPSASMIVPGGDSYDLLSARIGRPYHGFRVEKGPGLLYVAKALRQDFVEGNSFRMPENTYREGVTNSEW